MPDNGANDDDDKDDERGGVLARGPKRLLGMNGSSGPISSQGTGAAGGAGRCAAGDVLPGVVCGGVGAS
jgi:hypothetical protein